MAKKKSASLERKGQMDTHFILFRLPEHRTFRLNTYGRNKEAADEFFKETLKLTDECYLYKMEGLTAKIIRVD